MSEWGQITPADVRDAMACGMAVLRPHAEDDWSRQAGPLDWDCRATLAHLCHAIERYAMYLAGPWHERLPFQIVQYTECSVSELLLIAELRAAVLSRVAEASPPDLRAYHVWGRPDWTGYVAMGSVETLLHTDDIAQGLGLKWSPPADLCGRVTYRLFPWAPTDVEPWQALQWVTGRIGLPGRDRVGSNWAWHASPVDEWDGVVKTTGGGSR